MNYESDATRILQELGKQQERIFLDQLGDLVKKGLLVCETELPMITQDYALSDTQGQYKYRLTQKVRFELKDKGYIAALESENAALKRKIEEFKDALSFVKPELLR